MWKTLSKLVNRYYRRYDYLGLLLHYHCYYYLIIIITILVFLPNTNPSAFLNWGTRVTTQPFSISFYSCYYSYSYHCKVILVVFQQFTIFNCLLNFCFVYMYSPVLNGEKELTNQNAGTREFQTRTSIN